jgi:hypothetical protein
MARYRVTVDTGGTFSDFVYLDEDTGAVSIGKIPSTPDDPSRAILQGIERLHGAHGVGYFCHGTTVGTNALLEGKGAKTALLVTEGFRGIYPVGEQARPYGPAIFDVMFDKPAPLVPPSRTGEVKERVDFRGNILLPLDEPALRQTVRALAAEDIESIIARMGEERFVNDAADAGFDGLIVPDTDLDAAGELKRFTDARGLSLSLLIAPTSSAERIERIVAEVLKQPSKPLRPPLCLPRASRSIAAQSEAPGYCFKLLDSRLNLALAPTLLHRRFIRKQRKHQQQNEHRLHASSVAR